jgi:hypothetical protein
LRKGKRGVGRKYFAGRREGEIGVWFRATGGRGVFAALGPIAMYRWFINRPFPFHNFFHEFLATLCPLVKSPCSHSVQDSSFPTYYPMNTQTLADIALAIGTHSLFAVIAILVYSYQQGETE